MNRGDKFSCACGKQQSYAAAHEPGGITAAEARALGWVRTENGWLCPQCSGQGERIEKAFAPKKSA